MVHHKKEVVLSDFFLSVLTENFRDALKSKVCYFFLKKAKKYFDFRKRTVIIKEVCFNNKS